MGVNWQQPFGRDSVDERDELHVDLHPVARVLLLVALVRRQAIEAQPAQDPPHPRRGRSRRRSNA